MSREIHRNGWLRCIPYLQTSDQLPKSHLENLFVSFCIHDDDGPWLEFYDNRHCSADHKPVERFSLSDCLHISPRLVSSEEDCYEFAVTLRDKVLRLATESQELTADWVATLTEKLRERGIFRPKENDYSAEPSKPPHPRQNMPLPPPPESGERVNDRVFLRPAADEVRTSLLSMVESSVPFLRQESIESNGSSSSSGTCSSTMTASIPQNPSSSSKNPFTSPRDPNSPLPAPPLNEQPIYEPIFPIIERSLNRTESARFPKQQKRECTLSSLANKRHSYTGGLEESLNAKSDSTSTSQQAESFERSSSNSVNPLRTSLRSQLTTQGRSAADRLTESNVEYSIPPRLMPGISTHQSVTAPPDVPSRVRVTPSEPQQPLSPKPARAIILRREMSSDQNVDQNNSPGMDSLQNNTSANQDRIALRNSTVVPTQVSTNSNSDPTHVNVSQTAESLYVEICETSTTAIPLREAQISKLQEEMTHQAGVLVKFAKRDLYGSLALVDVGGAVYIAGWNKPQMKTHLHVGDRLLNICGRRVISASEAHKTIKSLVINQTVELTIHRMPYGKALAMRRSFEGENLGLILDSGSNDVLRVLEGGLAYRCGLPFMVPTVLDGGMALTSWWITEVNNRPINLFYKNSEIEPRLRAVGKDISIVLQPSDFIRALKKQLKSIRSYKNFVVQ